MNVQKNPGLDTDAVFIYDPCLWITVSHTGSETALPSLIGISKLLYTVCGEYSTSCVQQTAESLSTSSPQWTFMMFSVPFDMQLIRLLNSM